YKARQVFQCRGSQAFDFVEQAMIQAFSYNFQGSLYLTEITQETCIDGGLATQRYFDIKGVAMQAAVLCRARAQMVGGVESELLDKLYHGRAYRVFVQSSQGLTRS